MAKLTFPYARNSDRPRQERSGEDQQRKMAKVEDLPQKVTADDASTKQSVLRHVIAEYDPGANSNIVFQAPL